MLKSIACEEICSNSLAQVMGRIYSKGENNNIS
jgi:hypothetical protein